MKALKLTLTITAIYMIYITASTLNEKMLASHYPDSITPTSINIKPSTITFDMLISSKLSLLFSAPLLVIRQQVSPIPLSQKVLLGFLYTNYVSCMNYALSYVPYTIRIFWDKMGYLSVILVSLFFSRYPPKAKFHLKSEKIKTALVISAGALICSYFFVASQKKSEKSYGKSKVMAGYAFIAISLICKGFFIDNQSFIKNTYKPTQFQLLYTVNFLSFIFSCLYLLCKQQLIEAFLFCFKHKEITTDILKFSGLAVIGQILMYYLGFNFQLKQNMLPLISMTRKVLSMLLSLYLFQRVISVGMMIGLVLVFGGLFYEIVDETYYLLTKTSPMKVVRDSSKVKLEITQEQAQSLSKQPKV